MTGEGEGTGCEVTGGKCGEGAEYEVAYVTGRVCIVRDSVKWELGMRVDGWDRCQSEGVVGKESVWAATG